jgi:probable F420-dependent oxidoreductase
MNASPYGAPAPAEQPPTLLAALGPKMLELAATHADGAHPYWTTPEHTAQARAILGPDKLLCVEQKVVLTTDAAAARAAASAAVRGYAGLPNYRNTWLRLGFSDDEIEQRTHVSSARWSRGAMPARCAVAFRHTTARTDHVCIQPLSVEGFGRARLERALEALAP